MSSVHRRALAGCVVFALLWMPWPGWPSLYARAFRGGTALFLALLDCTSIELEPLPGHSIWRQRIPDAEQRTRSLYVALEGSAFVRQPSTGALLELEHFLRLPPDLREKDVGVGYLAALAEGAELPLAVSALERLAAVPDLDGRLDAGGAASLVGALLRSDGDGAPARAIAILD